MITVEELVQREVIYCVSYLVSDLLTLYSAVPSSVQKETGTDYDELLNLCSQDDWEAAVDTYIDNMDRGELVEALEAAGVEDERSQADITLAEVEDLENGFSAEARPWPGLHEKTLRAKLLDHLREEDELEDFAREHNLDPERNEVYEHWIVTRWFADKLEEKGEVVGRDICGIGAIWGRTTTGQAISMDWVIQQIHKDLVGDNS
jgi:hypothetical protein